MDETTEEIKTQIEENNQCENIEQRGGSPTKRITLDLAYIALFVAIISVCSWISIPFTVPFTMQVFGVFCALGLIGGRRGTIAIVVYIILGMIGVPIFANFSSGFAVILGTTGGYLIGFIASGLIYWGATKLFGNKLHVIIIAMLIGLIVMYAIGTVWFLVVWLNTTGAITLAAVLGWCVVPYIIPDLIKITLAIIIIKVIPKHVKIFK